MKYSHICDEQGPYVKGHPIFKPGCKCADCNEQKVYYSKTKEGRAMRISSDLKMTYNKGDL